jgi:tryptophan 2,3-dioxygenase
MPGPLYYGDYLQLDRLLSCQDLERARHGEPAHDEMLFIIVHQAYELWFKQILWELDAVCRQFGGVVVQEKDVGRAVSHLGRIVEVQRVLIQQVDVLETLTPLDFLEFRDDLVPASGFQSAQFRLIENRMGLRQGDRLRYSNVPYTSRLNAPDRTRLEASEEEPSLFDLIERWLARTPFLRFGAFDFWHEYHRAVERMLQGDRRLIESNPTLTDDEKAKQLRALASTEAQFGALFDADKHAALVQSGELRLSHKALQAALLINLYRDEPILHLPFRVLSLLMDIDEKFTTWRYRHALMVLRMIGTKIGTGGSSGHEYLRDTAEKHRIFGDLFFLSTFYIPRSSLPKLPPEVEQTMGFIFSGKPD